MEYIEKICDATIDNLHEVLDFIEAQLETHEASMKNTNVILIAAEEMFTNIAFYAYPDTTGQAKIAIGFDEDVMYLKLEDSGIEFNPLEKIDPDIHAKAEDRDIGGLGIYMVKKSMDDCEYMRVDNKNIFIMKKSIK